MRVGRRRDRGLGRSGDDPAIFVFLLDAGTERIRCVRARETAGPQAPQWTPVQFGLHHGRDPAIDQLRHSLFEMLPFGACGRRRAGGGQLHVNVPRPWGGRWWRRCRGLRLRRGLGLCRG